jgi:hypothetical protein
MVYRIRDRKRWREFLALLKVLRARWPGERLYVIVDNFSPHRHPNVRAWAAAHDVELVFLPTYASWLNWIEPEFAALRYFRPQRDRPRQPRRARPGDRRLPALAQRPSRTQDQLRPRLGHPHLDRLQDQRCTTRYLMLLGGVCELPPARLRWFQYRLRRDAARITTEDLHPSFISGAGLTWL